MKQRAECPENKKHGWVTFRMLSKDNRWVYLSCRCRVSLRLWDPEEAAKTDRLPYSHRDGPDTEEAAARKADEEAKTLRGIAEEMLIAGMRDGVIALEFCRRVDPSGLRPEHGIRPRLTELCEEEFGATARKTRHRRKNERGNSEMIYMHVNFYDPATDAPLPKKVKSA